MAVTTSVFPNLNTFRLGPEFCILFHKLESTCRTHKRATLTERYPDLCESLEENPKQICQRVKSLPIIDMGAREDLPFEDFTSSNTIIDFNDKLTRLVYR